MKRIKGLAAAFTAAVIVFSALPISSFTEAATGTDNIIWELNPDNVLSDNEGKVDALFTSGYGEAKYNVYKKCDDAGAYFGSEFSETGNGGENYAAAKGSINDKTSGFGWINSRNVLNAIAPYLYISFEYRVTAAEDLPEDATLNISAAQAYDPKIAELASVNVSDAENWTEYPLTKISAPSFDTSWYSGFITYNLSSASGGFNGTQTVEIKNLILVLKNGDKNKINMALNSVSGIADIANFTQGIYVNGSPGRKDYCSLLTSYDKFTSLSGKSYSGAYRLKVDYPENCDIALSRTLAEGSEDINFSDSVTVKVRPAMNYNIEAITATTGDGTVITADVVTRNSEYQFNMPAGDVKVTAKINYEEERELAFLWKCHPATLATDPWYNGPASRPYSWSLADGGDESAYKFDITNNAGTINIYGSKNVNVTLERYYDTAYFYTSIKLVTESEDRTVKIGISEGKIYEVTIPDTEEFTLVKIPFKAIAAAQTANFVFFRVYIDNREIGDTIYVGETFVFNKEIDGTVDEAWSQIFDMSGYTKSETNTLLGVIGDTEGTLDPWCEDWISTVTWDLAWYYSFQNMAPYILIPQEDRMGQLYFTTFYGDRIDAAEYIDTGYLEFYIYCDTDGIEVPFSVEAAGHANRTFATFKVKYDKSKARPDGYMQVRIPFTYFADAGLNMDQILRVTIKGTQTSLFCDYFLISSFRFYSNLADVPDPEPIVEPEPEPERDLPLELDSSIINAKLDKENLTLYIPENTMIWEILAALTFDTDETNVDFYNGKFIEDDETVLTEDMSMVVYRRGYLLTQFNIRQLTEEKSGQDSVADSGNSLPDTGDDSMPMTYIFMAILSGFGVLVVLANRKRINRRN